MGAVSHESHPHRLSVGRIVGCALILFALWNTFLEGTRSIAWARDFERWQTDRPMQSTLDLTRPGETSIPYLQTCEVAHGQPLILALDGDGERLDGLRGELRLLDGAGSVIAQVAIDGEKSLALPEGLRLGRIPPLRNGEYTARVTIESGANDPTLTEVDLFATYELCGMEAWPGKLSGAIAVAAGLFAVLLGIFVVPGVCRHGLRRAPSFEPEQPDAEAP